MAYSDQEKREELVYLADFLNSVEIAAKVLEKGPYSEEISLLISLPTAEDQENLTAENAADKLHLAVGHLLPLEEEEARIIKYLSLYTQIRVGTGDLSELEILKLVNEMTCRVRVGSFYYGPGDAGESMIQYRAMVMGLAEEHLDGGVAAETILEMGIGYDQMKMLLEGHCLSQDET